jgi:hypothetical protein
MRPGILKRGDWRLFRVQSSGETRAVADLQGQAARRPVQNGLAVKADKIDRGAASTASA